MFSRNLNINSPTVLKLFKDIHRNINIAYSHSQCKYYKQSYAQVVCCLQTTNVDLSSSITRLVLIHMLLQFAYPILIWQTFMLAAGFYCSNAVLTIM